jgi:hypothetical protein
MHFWWCSPTFGFLNNGSICACRHVSHHSLLALECGPNFTFYGRSTLQTFSKQQTSPWLTCSHLSPEKILEPTFLAVAQGLIQKSHVNIGEYIRASNWRTCECSFIKFLPILVWRHQVTSRMLVILWNFMKLVEVVVGWSIDFSFSIRKVDLKCLWCLTRNQACLQTAFQSF